MRLALYAPLLLTLAACGTPPAPAPQMPPPPVGVAAPLARELPVVRTFTGVVEAVHTIEVRPRVAGTITEVLVADGAEVTAGQPLFRIDPLPFQAALARSEAAVAVAQARLRQAELALGRAASLRKDEIVAQSSFDEADAAVAVAKAEVAAAMAGRTTARLNLDHTTVTAPVAGRLGRVLAAAGNVALGTDMALGTHLATLVSSGDVYVAFDLDEATWNRLAVRLTAATVGGAAIPVQVGLAGEDGHPHTATLAVVDNQVSSTSGSLRLRARLSGTTATPGAYARVAFEVEPARPVLLVHETVLQSQLTTRFVFTVDAQGITAFRPVQVGEAVATPHGPLRVVTGLGPDDRVAVTNLARIFFPGMPVTPVPADMATVQPIVGSTP